MAGDPSLDELPRDGKEILGLLKSMGVSAIEPRVLHQLLDFEYRYTAECLQDAEAIAERSLGQRPTVQMAHILLAGELRSAHTFTSPPSYQVLQQLAAEINAQPLPEIKPAFGLRLPPEDDCLLAPNYQLEPPATPSQRAAEDRAGAATPNGNALA
ncbi:hypothetical protein QBZ16_005220 [Prototheca wickerhamii]|uniref:Transcription initiation factor TFIID subunit 9 n=1 Tax=Prototheca wickerhamii TaxID=3111 RepID=A0AAD9IJ11_PROWI|nr:hypothetical protein QBZ16_005220 [Prototheca wickerhamii]